MTKLATLLLFIVAGDALGQMRNPFNNLNIKEDSILVSANRKLSTERLAFVSKVDTITARQPEKVEVFAIVDDSKRPVRVLNEEWPEGVIVSINVLKDKGKIIYYAEYPTSQSGDWFISYQYYFDELGSTIAFKRVANFFNTECTESVAYERSLYLFGTNLNLIEKQYFLSDQKDNDLTKKQCYFNYDYKYTIKSNNQLLLK